MIIKIVYSNTSYRRRFLQARVVSERTSAWIAFCNEFLKLFSLFRPPGSTFFTFFYGNSSQFKLGKFWDKYRSWCKQWFPFDTLGKFDVLHARCVLMMQSRQLLKTKFYQKSFKNEASSNIKNGVRIMTLRGRNREIVYSNTIYRRRFLQARVRDLDASRVAASVRTDECLNSLL